MVGGSIIVAAGCWAAADWRDRAWSVQRHAKRQDSNTGQKRRGKRDMETPD